MEITNPSEDNWNLDVQGTCSLIATTGFNNLLKTATAKKMYLAPAIIVHDAIIAYSKAKDIELIYNHYTENFLNYLGNNYGFWFPFDIEIACNYYNKVLLSKGKESLRHYSVSGTNISVFEVLSRCVSNGKIIKFLDENVTLESIKSSIDNKDHLYRQFQRGGGAVSFDRDFSYGSYNIEFVD